MQLECRKASSCAVVVFRVVSLSARLSSIGNELISLNVDDDDICILPFVVCWPWPIDWSLLIKAENEVNMNNNDQSDRNDDFLDVLLDGKSPFLLLALINDVCVVNQWKCWKWRNC